jgi:DNA processing protein
MTLKSDHIMTEQRERTLALALDAGLGWAAARRMLRGEAALGDAPAARPRPAATPDQGLAALARVDGRLLLLGDAEFPASVALMPAGPVGLFLKGTLPAGPTLAIVGARACTRAAARLAYALAAAAAAAGRTVVSGGALGVDAAAHEGALAAGGRTVAVLGSGLDRPYPTRHAGLFERVARTGALVTPFPPGVEPRRENFPRRNGVVAALADHVLVVEARVRSGALLTARDARGLGRPLGATPGSTGCDRLIASGARPVASPEELTAWLKGEPARPFVPRAPTPEAERALEACDAVPRAALEIAARAGLDEEAGRVALGFLELWGLVCRGTGDRFVRTYKEASAHHGESRQ